MGFEFLVDQDISNVFIRYLHSDLGKKSKGKFKKVKRKHNMCHSQK